MKVTITVLCVVGLFGDHQKEEFFVARPVLELMNDIDTYYKNKYPGHKLEAEASFGDTLTPVERIISSNPFSPYRIFEEQTEKSKTEILVTKVDLFSENEGRSCRVVISVFTLAKVDNNSPYSTVAPITAKDIHDLSNRNNGNKHEGTLRRHRRIGSVLRWGRDWKSQ